MEGRTSLFPIAPRGQLVVCVPQAGLSEATRLIAAGIAGGPLIIGVLTPVRFCLALAAQDRAASFTTLWRQVWSGGVRQAYKGWLAPMPAAMVQFTALGPLYHLFAGFGGAAVGVALSASVETAVCFGPEMRSVQLAFNQSVPAARQVVLRHYVKPWGPGVLALYGRNVTSSAGIRVLSDPVSKLTWTASESIGLSLGDSTCKVAGDFISSLIAGSCSMPFNQTFYYSATSRQVQEAAGFQERLILVGRFLRTQYFTESGGVSRTMSRDVGIRAAHNAFLFAMYAAIERAFLSMTFPGSA